MFLHWQKTLSLEINKDIPESILKGTLLSQLHSFVSAINTILNDKAFDMMYRILVGNGVTDPVADSAMNSLLPFLYAFLKRLRILFIFVKFLRFVS
jgi:hypothetical protein